jgi:hypothetical protein
MLFAVLPLVIPTQIKKIIILYGIKNSGSLVKWWQGITFGSVGSRVLKKKLFGFYLC